MPVPASDGSAIAAVDASGSGADTSADDGTLAAHALCPQLSIGPNDSLQWQSRVWARPVLSGSPGTHTARWRILPSARQLGWQMTISTPQATLGAPKWSLQVSEKIWMES